MQGTNPKFQSSVFIHTVYCTIRLFCVVFDITDFKKLNSENQWSLVSKASNYILSYILRILESHEDFTQVQVHWPTEICLFESDFYVRCNSYIIHYWQWASDILWRTFAQSCCMTSEHLCCEHIVHNFFYDTYLIFDPFLRIGHFHRHPIHFLLYGQRGKDILKKITTCVS